MSMSVLIRGMEMPTNCEKCLGFERCYTRGLFDPIGWCHITGTELLNPNPPADCPLVPVPAHGRLGDLDALYESCALDTNIDVMASAKRINEYMQIKIDDAPTIIQASEEGE